MSMNITLPLEKICPNYLQDSYCIYYWAAESIGINKKLTQLLINQPIYLLYFAVFAAGYLSINFYLCKAEKVKFFLRFILFTLVGIVLGVFVLNHIFNGTELYELTEYLTLNLLWFFLTGGVFGFIVFRCISILWQWIKSVLTVKTSSERNVKTDIRTVNRLLPKYVNKSAEKLLGKGSYFIGFNQEKSPVFMQRDKYVSSHKQLIGTTGCGKGMQIQSLVYQDCCNKDIPVLFMPKADLKAKQAIEKIAKDLDQKIAYIDLLYEKPQLNLFKKKSVIQIVELLEAAFGLTDKGTDADFYRLNDRQACKLFADFIHQRSGRLINNVQEFISLNECELKDSPKFKADLLELAALASVSAGDKGLSIEELIATNTLIYISGSMRHSVAVKAQKLLLLSVMQACETRSRYAVNHVGIYLDEFKYLISRPALEALGAIRDKKAFVTIAHQSLGDLRDCGSDLDPDSVVSAINENCSIKLAYKVHDPDTADWLARMTGTILVDDEHRKFKTNSGLVEVDQQERVLRQSERHLVDSNMFMSLPHGCAVLIGDGLAKYVSTAPIKLDETAPEISPIEIIDDDSQISLSPKMGDLIDVD